MKTVARQLVLIRQDPVLVTKVLASLQLIFEFFLLVFLKDGLAGRWETKHFMGMA